MSLRAVRMSWLCLSVIVILLQASAGWAAPLGCLWLGHRKPTVNASAVNGYTPTRWRSWADFQQPCPAEVVEGSPATSAARKIVITRSATRPAPAVPVKPEATLGATPVPPTETPFLPVAILPASVAHPPSP